MAKVVMEYTTADSSVVVYSVGKLFQVYRGLSLKYIGSNKSLAVRVFNTQCRI